MAQQPAPDPPPDQQQEPESQSVEKKKEETTSLGLQSFIDDVFQSTRNRLGFSLGVYEGYTSNVFAGPQDRQAAAITAFLPRAFVNFGKRKSRLHFDFGGGYRLYNRHGELTSYYYYDYSGSYQYAQPLSKRVSFHIADHIRSSVNDSGGFSFLAPEASSSGFSSEVLFNRQRITTNGLTATIDYASRRAHFEVFGGFQSYIFQENTIGNANAIQVGANFDFRIAKWLYLTNRYTTYLNNVDQRFRDARIHRLQVGGLDFRMGRFWRVWAGGGAELSDYQGINHVGGSVDAGVSRTSRKTALSLTYQRGFASAIGLSMVLRSDIFTASIGYRMNRWMNGRLSSSYYRSSELAGSGLLETFAGGGGLEFALRRDLVASLNYSYQNQHSRNFSVEHLGLNRYIAYFGLQYFWPSLR